MYAVYAYLSGKRFQGMLNIGFRPTVEGNEKTIEVHIINFNQDIYGEEIQIQLVKRLRDEAKFANLNELKAQISRDKIEALNCLREDL